MRLQALRFRLIVAEITNLYSSKILNTASLYVIDKSLDSSFLKFQSYINQ